MNNFVRVGLVAAAVIAAALLGYGYLAGQNIGGPGPSNEATSSDHPRASIGADLPVLSDQSGALEPGTYVVDEVEPLRLAITVPDGWTRNVAPATLWTEDSRVHIWFGRVDNLYADPCDTAGGDPVDPPLGPTAEDLADALASRSGVDATVNDVKASGFAGWHIELSLADPTGDECGGASRLWRVEEGEDLGLSGMFGTLGVWTFDVNGDRLVIAGEVRAAAAPAELAGLETIVDSLQIQAP